MRSERLTIQGLLRFNDRVSLDLRDLPPGLIAFVGGNGEGKTTMLETGVASWFRQLPSREKPLVDYVSRADGFIEHQFELEGQGVYTARVNLDGPHRVSEAVLTRVLPDGSTVFLNDGKLKTFDAAIAELLPPQAILLASVFAAQNRNGAFSKLDRKGKAELLSSLLGLNHLAALSSKAKLAAGVVQVEIEKLTARRDVLSRGGEMVALLDEQLRQLQTEGEQRAADKRLLGHDIRGVEQRLTLVAEASAQHAVATARAIQLVAEIAVRTADETRAAADLQDVDLSLMRDLDVAQTDLTARLSALDAEARDTSAYEKERRDADLVKASTDRAADERIENNRSYLADAEGIRAAARAVEETDTAIATFRKELGKLGAEVSAHLNTERAHRRRRARARQGRVGFGVSQGCAVQGRGPLYGLLVPLAGRRRQGPHSRPAGPHRAEG
jgi:DNA repair exonuclease SbcCD ATPase subunit